MANKSKFSVFSRMAMAVVSIFATRDDGNITFVKANIESRSNDRDQRSQEDIQRGIETAYLANKIRSTVRAQEKINFSEANIAPEAEEPVPTLNYRASSWEKNLHGKVPVMLDNGGKPFAELGVYEADAPLPVFTDKPNDFTVVDTAPLDKGKYTSVLPRPNIVEAKTPEKKLFKEMPITSGSIQAEPRKLQTTRELPVVKPTSLVLVRDVVIEEVQVPKHLVNAKNRGEWLDELLAKLEEQDKADCSLATKEQLVKGKGEAPLYRQVTPGKVMSPDEFDQYELDMTEKTWVEHPWNIEIPQMWARRIIDQHNAREAAEREGNGHGGI